MKRLSFGLAIASALVAPLGNHPSQASDCTNYWTNPKTGQQECLGKELQIVQPTQAPQSVSPSAPPTASSTAPSQTSPSSEINFETSDFDFSDLAGLETAMADLLKGLEIRTLEGSATGLVDHLQGCQPYRYSFALEFMPEMAISQNVMGDRNGNCVVNVSLKMSELGGEETVAYCQFTPASLAILTDELAYAEAKAFDSNDWDAIGEISPERGSAIFERECQATS